MMESASSKINKAIFAVYTLISDPQQRSWKQFNSDYTKKAEEIGDIALFFYLFRNEFKIDQLQLNKMINHDQIRRQQRS